MTGPEHTRPVHPAPRENLPQFSLARLAKRDSKTSDLCRSASKPLVIFHFFAGARYPWCGFDTVPRKLSGTPEISLMNRIRR